MSASAPGSQTFKVTHSEPFKPDNVLAGVIDLDANHYVHVVSAEPQFAAKLGVAADMLNSSDTFLLNEPPPGDEETRKQYRRIVARDAADAREALLTILSDRYGFALTPGA